MSAGSPERALRRVWAAYALSGAAALADEVVWTRYLQVLLGSSVYAVAAMLAAMMAGLAVGSVIGARFGDRVRDPARAIAACEVGIAAAALLSLAVLRVVPDVHLWAFQRFQLSPLVYFGLDVALCIPVVLAPTTLMGVTFPLVARIASALRSDRIAEAVGGAYAANTFGAIVGSLLAGFALVPVAGLWGALVAAALANVGAAALILSVSAGSKVPRAAPLAALLAAAGLAWWAAPSRMPVGYHLAGRVAEDPGLPDRLRAMSVIFDRWPVQGRVQVLEDGDRTRVLLVDGRIEGSTGTGEQLTQHLLALLPGALRGPQRDVFAIGLGTGRTLARILETYPDAKVELAEVNPCVVEAVTRFFHSDLASVTVGDGRSVLASRSGPYDAIVSAPSFPVDASSGGLFTREFFQLARARLRPGGVLVAWVPGYLLDGEQLRALVATAASAFPELSVWRIAANDDLVLVASGAPFADADLPAALARVDEPYWKIGVLEPVVRRAGLAAFLGGERGPRLHSDVDPWLELAMARNLVRGRAWLER